MKKKFREYTQPDFSGINKEILAKWEEENLFAESLRQRTDAPSFIFYEGPPSANGMPGIHHVIARSLKDIFCRYKTMKGYRVGRRAGWDTHGLPVELGVEKLLGITKDSIGKTISVAEYNATCRREVMKYTAEWEQLTKKMGYWVDMDHPYITYKNKYIETLWWLLADLHKKGFLYKGYTIQPYSPAAGTGLSTHELNQPGCYRDVKDTVCTAQFKVLNPKKEWSNWGDAYFLAWTTTPWTLPSNTALCVGPNIEYVAIETFNPYTSLKQTIIMGAPRVEAYFDPKNQVEELPEVAPKEVKKLPWRIVGRYKGSELAELQYEQLIPWVKPDEGAFRVITGDFVTTEDGTGIVHIAPTFGADDRRVAQQNNIPSLVLIDRDGQERPMVDLKGRFYKIEHLSKEFVASKVDLPLYDVYAGRYVKNAYSPEPIDDKESLDIDICVMLKMENKAFRIEKHTHNYPHCWRTDKPILYYPLDSWFIRTTACREQMIALNDTINWKPESTGSGRFGKWLENLQDWNLSRSRFWGTPLNIWRSEDGSEERCIASVEELYQAIEESIAAGVMKSNPFKGFTPGDYSDENYEKIDLHRPVVDEIKLVSPSGKVMTREQDLIDVWFDSGAMPFAQVHYPFEHKEEIESGELFPADFIAEGIDQTRGWFFTLHAISTMVRGSVAFKNVLANGLVLDKNGNKMSKRLGNAVDPFATIEQYGSDPLRWYMITNASPWDNIKFDPEGIKEVSRKFFGTLYNTYQFFALYANLDGFIASEQPLSDSERPEIDRWIRSLLHSLIAEVDQHLANYEPTKAGRAIDDFVSINLSNWYVRLSRKRFWAGEMSQDKLSAYQTLYECLTTIARLIAPIAPFYADHLYRDLVGDGRSVHLADFPESRPELIDQQLEERMQIAQELSSMVLALRRKVNIKVRQPLSLIMLPISNEEEKAQIEAIRPLLLSEVNVKDISYVDASESIWSRRIKPDFKKLGPRYGKIMKPLAQAIADLQASEIAALDRDGFLELTVADTAVRLERSDVDIIVEDIPGWLVATEGTRTVALDVTLTEQLIEEGLAREFVNRIQNVRKQAGFEVNDHIDIIVLAGSKMDPVLQHHHDYIARQVQAESILLSDTVSDAVELEFDDFCLSVSVTKNI